MKLSFSPIAPSLFWIGVLLCVTVNGAWAGTQLGQSMKQLGMAYKELSNDLKQPQDADKEKYLALVATIKEQAKKAHDLPPRLAQTLPPDQHENMVQSYQKDMDKFMQDIDGLGDAVKNGQWDDARKLMDTLHQDMSAGHKQYRAKKDDQIPPPTSSAPSSPSQNPAPAPTPPAQ